MIYVLLFIYYTNWYKGNKNYISNNKINNKI